MQPHSILWDVETVGFNARRQFSEAVTYSCYFRSRIDGKQRFMRIGRHGPWTPDLARDRAKEIIRAKDRGQDPAGAAEALKASPDMNALLDDYEATVFKAKRATTVASDKSRIKQHLRPTFGTQKVAAVTQEQVEKFVAALSPGGARRTLALLSAIFNFAVKKKLIAVNPCTSVAKPKNNPKTRRLMSAEYKALGAALTGDNNPAHDLILFLAVTGWRRDEGRLLRRSVLDLERRAANLEDADTKTGASVRPLSAAALDIIARQPSGDSVFGNLTRGALYHAWGKLGMPKDVTHHTLRHSFASLAADLGYSDSVIGGMIGHRQSSIISRYLHIEAKLIEAADATAEATLKLMAHGPSTGERG